MTEEKPQRIAVPFAQRWRDARLRIIPVVVFGGAVLALALLWKGYVAAPTMLGQAEAVVAQVSSYKPGVLAQLNVSRFQLVRAGDTIGTVVVADPKVLASSLAVIQSEIALLRANLKPIASQQRNAMDYAQLRLDWMGQRAKLAGARIDLQLAEAQSRRMQELFNDKIVSQRVYDQAKADKDRLQSQVKELGNLVDEGERSFKDLQLTNTVEVLKVSTEPQVAALAVEEAKLKLTEAQLSPIILRAPIDGVVSRILHRSGESVTAGQPIVSIATLNPLRIVGYLRPPITEQPRVGMRVQVRSPGLPGQIGWGRIDEVGAQLEPVPATVIGPVKISGVELALPVSVSVPSNLKIRPGELVNLTLVSGPN
jgi:multidrug resistance efflux pump